MRFLNVVTNVVKAGLAVAVTPAAVVADVLALPSSAYNATHPFQRTGALLDAAGKRILDATNDA